MSAMLSRFRSSCCDTPCCKQADADFKEFLSQGNAVAKDLLQAALVASQTLDAVVPKLILFLTLAKQLFATDPKVLADIDFSIKALNALMLTKAVALDIATDATALPLPTDLASLLVIVSEGQDSIGKFSVYIDALKTLGLQVGDAPKVLAKLNTVSEKISAVVTLGNLVNRGVAAPAPAPGPTAPAPTPAPSPADSPAPVAADPAPAADPVADAPPADPIAAPTSTLAPS